MINIAELLKDCPKGTKLYSPLFGEVFLYTILSESKFITVRTADSITTFNELGQWGDNSRWERFPDAECLLFPSKEVRTWEGWKAPVESKFKVGDWITDGTCKAKIAAISNTYYWYSKNSMLGEIESIDKKYHIWTIKDAKDGDILSAKIDGDDYILLFKQIKMVGLKLMDIIILRLISFVHQLNCFAEIIKGHYIQLLKNNVKHSLRRCVMTGTNGILIKKF